MRGQQERSGSLFSYVSIEERIPPNHPHRRIRPLAVYALHQLKGVFGDLYAREGRPSVPPEQLLLASLLQAFYGLRSARRNGVGAIRGVLHAPAQAPARHPTVVRGPPLRFTGMLKEAPPPADGDRAQSPAGEVETQGAQTGAAKIADRIIQKRNHDWIEAFFVQHLAAA